MSCKCAEFDQDKGRYECSVSGSECMYYVPDSEACARDYGEGPDAMVDDGMIDINVKAQVPYERCKECNMMECETHMNVTYADCNIVDRDIEIRCKNEAVCMNAVELNK